MSKIITVPFTENFLPHVVDYIHRYYEEKDKDMSRLCLVFGGRRPALFIKRDLARRLKRAYVPPRFFTIDEWMSWAAYGASDWRLLGVWCVIHLQATLLPKYQQEPIRPPRGPLVSIK